MSKPHLSPKPLAISCGDPAGIGPAIAIQAAKEFLGKHACVLFGDAEQLHRLAEQAKLPYQVSSSFTPSSETSVDHIHIVDVARVSENCIKAHKATAEGGQTQLLFLDAALDAVFHHQARALITAPMSKEAVTLSGKRFSGHTEHLAQRAGLQKDEVSMLFLGSRLRVGTVSTHIAIADAPPAITTTRVLRTIRHLSEAMMALCASGQLERPCKLYVCGLNPHAGEAGLFGQEEINTIGPAIETAKTWPAMACGDIELIGPLGAESAIRFAASDPNSGVVTMLHDQATIACKLVDWTHSVNVTWGLPFVRTSVDHGVAYDAAAAGEHDPESMACAARMGLLLSERT